jgi:hypothetical protein
MIKPFYERAKQSLKSLKRLVRNLGVADTLVLTQNGRCGEALRVRESGCSILSGSNGVERQWGRWRKVAGHAV